MSKKLQNNKKKLNVLIKSRVFEDQDTLETIDSFFLKKRGFVVKMPKKGSDVLLLVSGGIDSIASWAILMDIYGLKVHPICINTGQKRHIQEKEAVKLFATFFKKKYPQQYVEPFYITYPSSAPEIAQIFKGNLQENIHSSVIAKNRKKGNPIVAIPRKYLFPALIPYPAALTALLFDLTKNKTIRTIFTSILPTDGIYNSSQTLTSLRSTMFSLCAYTHEYEWQVISPCFDEKLNFCLHKSDLIAWSHKKDIPIHLTYSCLKGQTQHCGKCIVCGFRKESFTLAKVDDQTNYIPEPINFFEQSAFGRRVQFHLKRVARFFSSKKPSTQSERVVIKDYY